MPTRYHAILDAGDQLADAIAAGDLGRAEAVLRERAALIAAAAGGPLPSDDVLARFRDQDRVLRRALHGSLRELADSVSDTGRAATAVRAYTSTTTPAARLDTGRTPGLRSR